MNTSTSEASTFIDPGSPPTPRRVTIGPVDSKLPGFNEDLRDYLTEAGFVGGPGGVEWHREFENAIAADLATQAVHEQVNRLIAKHLQLPTVSIL